MSQVKISFYSHHTSKPYFFFSNFSDDKVNIDGKVYPTTEHYYQSMKFITTDPGYAEQVRLASTAGQCKKLGQEGKMNPKWDEIKYAVMIKALEAKTEQHPYIKKALIETGDALLIEASPYDAIWGIGKNGDGLNLLGKAWMEVR